jgi:hypothetical protein
MPVLWEADMSFIDIIIAGWRGAFEAVKANLPIFGILLAALAVGEMVQHIFNPISYVTQTDPVTGATITLPHINEFGLFVQEIVFGIFYAIVSAPAMVAVHRHVLLREDGRIWENQERLVRFAGLIFGVQFVLFIVPALLAKIFAILGLVALASFWLIGRLVPAYPAAALDNPTPLTYAWNNSKGHWWYIAGVMVVGIVPVAIVMVPLGWIALSGNIILSAVAAIPALVYVAVGAALASELYKKFGALTA